METTGSADEKIVPVRETVSLEIEELEPKIAPGRGYNHNETLVAG
jgi:hypothetical protein